MRWTSSGDLSAENPLGLSGQLEDWLSILPADCDISSPKLASPAGCSSGGSVYLDHRNVVEAQLQLEEKLLTNHTRGSNQNQNATPLASPAADKELKAIIAEVVASPKKRSHKLGTNGGHFGVDESSVDQVVGLVNNMANLVEQHAETLVASSSWADCLMLLNDGRVGLTRGSSFLLGCAYEVLGAGAGAGQLLLEAACDGEIRALLSLRRLSTDIEALPGLRLPLMDSRMVETANKLYKSTSSQELECAYLWFVSLADRNNSWATFAVGGLLGVGVPGVIEPNEQAMLVHYEKAASQGLPQAKYALACWIAHEPDPTPAHGKRVQKPSKLNAELGDDEQQAVESSTDDIRLSFDWREATSASDEEHSGPSGMPTLAGENFFSAALPFRRSASARKASESEELLPPALKFRRNSKSFPRAVDFLTEAMTPKRFLEGVNWPPLVTLSRDSLSDFMDGTGAILNTSSRKLLRIRDLPEPSPDLITSVGKRAVQLLQEAGRQHLTAADNKLGVWYRHGLCGLRKDEAEAVKFFDRAASCGHTSAHLNLGFLKQDRNTSEAMEHFNMAAQHGHPVACRLMAKSYQVNGQVRKSNLKSFMGFLKAAASQRDPEALYMMGMMHLTGEYTPKDEDKALSYLSHACVGGFLQAKYTLGKYLVNSNLSSDSKETGAMLLTEAAEAGHAEALYEIGVGKERRRLYHSCISYFVRAANAGSVSAMYKMGVMASSNVRILQPVEGVLLDERGSEILLNKVTAEQWYRKAAERGHREAQAWLGEHLYIQQDSTKEKEAVEWFTRAAEASHMFSQYRLGLCYQKGIGVPIDCSKAADYFELALSNMSQLEGEDLAAPGESSQERGRPNTHERQLALHRQLMESHIDRVWYSLATLYETGAGRPRNMHKAVCFYRQAADLTGHVPATVALGLCYLSGNGVRRDVTEGVRLLSVAAGGQESQGGFANTSLSLLYHLGTGSEAERLQRTLPEDQIEQLLGVRMAWTVLGLCYKDGRGVLRSEALGVKYLKKAGEAGEAMAMCALGDCFKTGQGVPYNMTEAVRLYRESAKRGNGLGHCWYGQSLEEGRGVDQVQARPRSTCGYAADDGPLPPAPPLLPQCSVYLSACLYLLIPRPAAQFRQPLIFTMLSYAEFS